MIILMHPSISFVTELDRSRKDYCILRCDSIQSGRNLPTFLMKMEAVLFSKNDGNILPAYMVSHITTQESSKSLL